MSINYRLDQDRAKTDLEKKLAVDKTLAALRAYLMVAGPYDRIEVYAKQNGAGFTILRTNKEQQEIDFQ